MIKQVQSTKAWSKRPLCSHLFPSLINLSETLRDRGHKGTTGTPHYGRRYRRKAVQRSRDGFFYRFPRAAYPAHAIMGNAFQCSRYVWQVPQRASASPDQSLIFVEAGERLISIVNDSLDMSRLAGEDAPLLLRPPTSRPSRNKSSGEYGAPDAAKT